MLLTEHYIALALELPDTTPGAALSIGIGEVAEKLSCTPRNANLLLKRMKEQGLVTWQAGVGRGNLSRLTLRADLARVLLAHFETLLRRGDVGRAAVLLRDDRLPPLVRDQLAEAFHRQFGLRTETNAGGPKDVLKMPMPYPIGSLDPAQLLWVSETWVAGQVFDAPCRYDPVSETVVPHLAHTWELNEAATEWRFHLRKGVRYHDGKPLSARDVVHSLERLKGSPAEWLLHGIRSVDTHGDHCVRISLERPNLLLPHLLANASAAVLPADHTWDGSKVAGTGPFRVTAHTGARLVLEAFDDHFQGRPLLDRVELWTVPPGALPPQFEVEQSERGAAAASGIRPGGRLHDVVEQGCQFIAFDYEFPGPQHDPAFRQAMRLVLNRPAWVQELGGDRLAPATGFSPRRSALADWPGWSRDSEAQAMNEARAWLSRSTYRGELLHLYCKPGPCIDRDAEWLVRRSEGLGVYIVPHPHDWRCAAATDAAAPPPNLHMGAEIFAADQAVSFVQMLTQDGSVVRQSLAPHWAAELGRFRDLFYAAAGPAERDLVAAAFEQWLAEDAKLLCNYHTRKRVGAPAALQGFQSGDFGLPDLRRLWIRP